jgi:mono/diheme cytochrome c family protein
MALKKTILTSVSVLITAMVIFLSGSIGAQEDQGVTLTPSGKVLSGGNEYRRYCAQCHGIKGKGDGPMAAALKVPPGDLTQLSKNNGGQFPFQHVYNAISGKDAVTAHGTSEMPAFYLQFARPRNQMGLGTLHRSDYQIDQEIKRITNYIKSIQEQ